MTTRGVPPGTPKPPQSGRKPGIKNKAGISKEEIMRCYERLGGFKWLVQFAKDNPSDFLGKVLVRVLPPLPVEKVEPAVIANQIVQIDPSNTLEIGRRVAFALAKAADILENQKIIEAPTPSTPLEQLIPAVKPEEVTIENYVGSSAEQGKKRNLI